jgi:hypothetical protein
MWGRVAGAWAWRARVRESRRVMVMACLVFIA